MEKTVPRPKAPCRTRSANPFDDPEDSIELAKALEAAGYTVETVREAFAGEDDSDDHAWVLEVAQADDRITGMVDIHGGWLCGDERLAAEPLPLSKTSPSG